MLGLAPGDAKILRTAGGRVNAGELESLSLAHEALGVERVAVVHHTECAAPGIGPESLEFDVRRVCADDRLRDIVVCGMRYDVRSGELAMVVEPRRCSAR